MAPLLSTFDARAHMFIATPPCNTHSRPPEQIIKATPASKCSTSKKISKLEVLELRSVEQPIILWQIFGAVTDATSSLRTTM
eukprot:2938074-Karenia_brevis.AAC.1